MSALLELLNEEMLGADHEARAWSSASAQGEDGAESKANWWGGRAAALRKALALATAHEGTQDGCRNCVRLRTEIDQAIGILYGGLDRDRDDGDTLRTLCVVLVNALARERGHE